MKKAMRVFRFTLCALAGTVFLSRWWYANPDDFPRFPASFWRYFDQLFGASNADDAHNVEFFIVVAASFLVAATVTTGVFLIVSHANRPR